MQAVLCCCRLAGLEGMSAVLRFRGSQQLGPALLPSPGEQAAASGSGAAAEVGARPAAAADGLDVNSRLPQAEQEGLPPLASFSRYFNQERVRIDKVMSCVLLVSCSQLLSSLPAA